MKQPPEKSDIANIARKVKRRKRKPKAERKYEIPLIQGILNKENEDLVARYYNNLLQVNFTFGQVVIPAKLDGFTTFKYRIKKKGNNNEPVRSAFKKRWW